MQLELYFKILTILVGCTGIEPVTSCMSSMHSKPTELTSPLPDESFRVVLKDGWLNCGMR